MYIALKPCKFYGRDFKAGEVVPADVVDARAVRRLKSQRIIAEANEQKEVVMVQAGKQLFAVPVVANEGEFTVELEPEELKTLFIVLQSTADKAGKLIVEQTNKDLLLCIHALDGRKSVQNTAKDRAMSLSETESGKDEKNDAAELPKTDEIEAAE